MFIELEFDNLDTLLTQYDKTLVMYGAGWCGNCKLLKPKFKKVSTENEDIAFAYVDADKLPNSRSLVTLSNIPTIVAFNKTENVGQSEGNKIDVVYSVLEKIK